MDERLSLKVRSVLVSKTNVFLDEIDTMMEKEGVDKAIKVGRTQFKTIMDGVGKASSVEELFLFISYQESKRNGWDYKCSNHLSVAQNVINSLNGILDGIGKYIEDEIDKYIEKDEVPITEDDMRIIRLKIAEKYMGYLFWKATIVTKRNRG